MKGNKWPTRLACGALILVTTVGAALAAGTQGSQSDPLVTLSYLNEKAIPEIMKQVDERIDQRAKELEKKVQEANGATAFEAVEAAAGKTVTLSAGSQILLCSGKAACVDGLVDLTEGTTLGGELAAYHLYIATGDGQKVTVSEKAGFMVMGGYSVK